MTELPSRSTMIEQIFARRLRQERRRAGLTQAALARSLAASGLDLDQTSLSRIESQQRRASLSEAVAIAEVLGLALGDLVRDEEVIGLRQDLDRLRLAAQVHAQELDDIHERIHQTREQLAETIAPASLVDESTLINLVLAKIELLVDYKLEYPEDYSTEDRDAIRSEIGRLTGLRDRLRQHWDDDPNEP